MPCQVYEPGDGQQMVQQPDGKRVLLGDFVRVLGQPAPGLARLLAGSNQLDAAFQTNTSGLQGGVDLAFPLLNGKLLLLSNASIGNGTLVLGPVTRQNLLRLNADGTPDAAFQATFTAGQQILDVVEQPDGKVLITGNFTQVNGQPVGYLARLNLDGSLDTPFQTALGSGLDSSGQRLALQANGGILVSGAFATVAGVAQRGLARLQPTGQFDSGFRPVLQTPVLAECLVIQPDGAVLIAGSFGSAVPATLRRFLATGAVDNSFQVGTWQQGFIRSIRSRSGNSGLCVQPDGRIIVATHSRTYNGTAVGKLLRLLADGTLDTSFTSPRPSQALSYEDDYMPQWLQLLPSGQLLLAGSSTPAASPGAPDNFLLLQANGTRDASFSPVVNKLGRVDDVVRQPDGKYLAGGSFAEFNGVLAGNLVRLNADGTVDTAFTAACTADYDVQKLQLQPDGKVLVGGRFGQIGGVPRVAIARLLPSGTVDAAFAPVSQQLQYSRAQVTKLELQPGGNVLIGGDYNLTNNPANFNVISRLNQLNGTTGVEMPGFPFSSYAEGTRAMLTQPDGKILMVGSNSVPVPAGGARAMLVWRLLPNGALDPAFQLTEMYGASNYIDSGTALALDNSGNIYVGGNFTRIQGVAGTYNLFRLFPNGQIDPSFTPPAFNSSANYIDALAVQPDGRVLVGGQMSLAGNTTSLGLIRLEANGVLDASFNPALGPLPHVGRLLAQADGAVVAVGDFASVGSQRINGMVRLATVGALSVLASQPAMQLSAWPVPAHHLLHIALAGAQPTRADLLDAQGRKVRSLAVSQTAFALPIDGLATGLYFLRVSSVDGRSIARRIAIE